ncbi:MAG: porin family protein [Porphyromonadaceae bacterium]|nr:porin family protein [Porphyromonadaceae bacterium]
MMKKLLLSLGLVLAALPATAQKTAFRIEGGASLSNMNISTFSQPNYEGKLKMNYRAGVALEMKLGSIFYLAPGVVIKGGGADVNLRNILSDERYGEFQEWMGKVDKELQDHLQSGGGKVALTSQAISIPLTLGFRIKPFRAVGVSIEGGPYLSYMLKEEIKLGSKTTSISDFTKRTIDSFSVSQFDYGVGGSATVEFALLYVRAGVDVGIKDRLSVDVDKANVTVKNFDGTKKILNSLGAKDMNFYLTVGFRF